LDSLSRSALVILAQHSYADPAGASFEATWRVVRRHSTDRIIAVA